MERGSKGFTLVELLIVIVVIAILATISIIVFQGIRERANNSARISNAQSFIQALKALAAVREKIGDLLNTEDGNMWKGTCISSDYSDINGDGIGDCAYNTSSNYVYARQSASLTAQFQAYGIWPGSGKGYPENKRADGTIQYLGPYAYYETVDGETKNIFEYTLEGSNQDCVIRPLVSWDGANAFSMADSSAKNSYVDGPTTICMILLPD